MLEDAMPFKGLLRYPGIILLACFTLNAAAITHYVDVNNLSPSSPYTSWATASTNIQKAVDSATNGDLILVTNGIYQTGGAVTFGSLSNRVAVNKLLTIQSVNGPLVTIIKGYQVPTTTNGDAAVRCVYLTNGASLFGFTLTNGATRIIGDSTRERCGGGVLCASIQAVLSNCVITANSANNQGGGAFSGTLINCTLVGNVALSAGGGVSRSTLNGCNVVSNAAPWTGGGVGGGAYYANSTNCLFTANFADSGGGTWNGTSLNCLIATNSARRNGGGSYGGTLTNCFIIGNSVPENASCFGGGSFDCTLVNCLVSANLASEGGGVSGQGKYYNCTINNNFAFTEGGGYGGGYSDDVFYNCIIYHNKAGALYDNEYNGKGGKFNYCCTSPLPVDGVGNISLEPQMADDFHLSPDSPCIGAGSAAFAPAFDINGESRPNPPSIGCDEYHVGTITGALTVIAHTSFQSATPEFPVILSGEISGKAASNTWYFADGTIAKNQTVVTHVWTKPGDYPVVFTAYNESFPAGIGSTVTVHIVQQPIHYVSTNSINPTSPYTSWDTAATNIQNAIDASSVAGAMVLVSNGVYGTGGRIVSGLTSNRVAVTKPVVVQSVNGPMLTTILGYQTPVTTNGPSAIRCVYVTNQASLSGFTLTKGAVQFNGDPNRDIAGGGVWCESTSTIVSNCIITGNSAVNGGGAFRGLLQNCNLFANTATNDGGAGYCSTFVNSALSNNFGLLGGGINLGIATNCNICGNLARVGGGIYSSTASNCKITGNLASESGGGSMSGIVINSIIVSNSATYESGGAYLSTLNNCIVYSNIHTNPASANSYNGTLSYCCTFPLPTNGVGNFTNQPLFMDPANGNFHLQPNSPCINAGNNALNTAATDFDGNPRIAGGTIDVGAYEFQNPATTISQLWLQQYGLSTDGSADFADSDHDGLNNWQEWIAGTDPTDPKSALYLHAVTPNSPGLLVQWDSVLGKIYSLERATNLNPSTPFTSIASQISGNSGATTYLDTNAVGNGPFFYRVRTGQ